LTNSKKLIISVLALAILTALFAPLVAADSSVGVSAGQWVKYGNFSASGTGIPMGLANQTDWVEINVVSVSGTNATLTFSGQYKNGTTVAISGMNLDVATGASNYSSGNFVFIIPSDLQKGDAIPLSGFDFPINVTNVETENVIGVNRNVCILNLTQSFLGISYKFIMTWDQTSGVLMGVNIAETTPYGNMALSFNAIDTNVFATGAAGTPMNNLIYIVIAVIVIVILVIVIAAFILMRRKPKAPPATPTETPSTTEVPAPN